MVIFLTGENMPKNFVKQSINIDSANKIFLEKSNFNISALANSWFQQVKEVFEKALRGEELNERDRLIFQILVDSQK